MVKNDKIYTKMHVESNLSDFLIISFILSIVLYFLVKLFFFVFTSMYFK